MREGKLIMLDNVPPGCCSECAANHAPYIPHNKNSLFYMYKTIKALKKHGIEVD